MKNDNNVNAIFVNLPAKDLHKTREFWTKLGFHFKEQFSDDNGLCLELKENSIYAMLLDYDFFGGFTNRPIADGSTSQVLLAIDVDSRERVDEIMRIALENGATRYLEPRDEGWMYYDRFMDLDGHQWEIMCGDESQFPNDV